MPGDLGRTPVAADEGDSDTASPVTTTGVVPRPVELLNQLPLRMKWEFTRRHPYYQQFWELLADDARAPSPDPGVRERVEMARAVLLLIGVTDVPHSPGTPFEDLGGNDLGRVWAGGAVAPATFQTLAGVLLVGLTPDACLQVGNLLEAYGSSTEGTQAERRYAALQALQELAGRVPALASFPDAPFVGINTNASHGAIEEAVRELVAGFKARRNVAETRRREDNLEDYLAVWDLREGWVGDRYDCAREQTLAQIGAALKDPVRTVQNRYRRAFSFIVGHEYTPELWEAVVGRYKWSLLTSGVPLPSVSSRRPRRTKQPRPVPETTLSGPGSGDGRGFVADPAVAPNDDVAALRADILDLIARGRPNAEIRAELEVTDDRFDAVIDYLRAHGSDAV
jgi:hypothetical protein